MGAVIFIIAGLLFAAYGGNYLYVSQTTNSAIHELNGIAGLGLGLLMFGVAWMLGSLSGLRNRVLNIEDLGEAAASDEFVRDVRDTLINPLTLLIALARAAGEPNDRQRDAIIGYVKAHRGLDRLSPMGRRGLTALLNQITTGEAAIRNAVAAVRDFEDEGAAGIRRAAELVVKTSKQQTASQQRLFEMTFSE